jgi:hypothetical protein
MKYVIIVGDGMADYPIESLGGRTPLMVARTRVVRSPTSLSLGMIPSVIILGEVLWKPPAWELNLSRMILLSDVTWLP